MHAFFVRELPEAGMTVELDKAERQHLFRILRARSGDEVKLLDGSGGVATARVEFDDRLRVIDCRIEKTPSFRLHLYCAAPRKARLDGMFKQAAELGVWSINLVECEFSVAQPGRSDRWTTLLQEACKQSGNPFLPQVAEPVKFVSAVEQVTADGWVGCYGALGEAGADAIGGASDAALFIGPEGGFSSGELAIFREKGFAPISFGPYILRLETAAICGLAILRRIRENG